MRVPGLAAALVVAASLALGACAAAEPAPVFVQREGDPEGVRWRLVPVGNAIVPAPHDVTPEFVDVSPDGRTATALFLGGNAGCHAVAGVRIDRADPAPPTVTVAYGMRLGVMGCTAEGAYTAVRVALDPPFAP